MELAPLTAEEVARIILWRYPPELSTYNFSGDESAAMLDPANRYHGIHHEGECIGYVCLGAEARVPGLEASPGVEDFGMGLAPHCVGHGMSRWLLPALIGRLGELGVLSGHTLRAVILHWNLRSLGAARAAGFTPVGELPGAEGTFIVLTRPLG